MGSDKRRLGLFQVIGPGILVAATGVGAGDLATGALSGAKIGVAVLWAVLFGAGLKFVLNEGLARWQLATGDTLLEGCARHFGRTTLAIFLVYMIVWSVLVGAALMNACGIAAHAMLPLNPDEPHQDKIIYGVLHSLVAIVMVLGGGYRLFQRVMNFCIVCMFVTVVVTVVMMKPDWSAVFQGALIPSLDFDNKEALNWTLALMGGVGGTLTVLCYGYWITEEGRTGVESINACRIDLAIGYLMTAIFGMGMVILGSNITVDTSQKGATLVVTLGEQLLKIGPWAKWAFLVGAWGAFISSLLGVWQSVPYMFADVCRLLQGRYDHKRIDTKGKPYVLYLIGLGILPIPGLWGSFVAVQKYNALLGASFMPILAVTLLALNRRKHVGAARNSIWTTALLVGALAFFAWWIWLKLTA